MKCIRKIAMVLAIFTASFCPSSPACAQNDDIAQDDVRPWRHFRTFGEATQNQRENQSHLPHGEWHDWHSDHVIKEEYNGRDIIVYMPAKLPPSGQRSMVVALHGGMGNAQFFQKHLHLDEIAEKYGFIVAYLNGSPAAFRLPDRFRAWNAGGGCCGKPAATHVDDRGYITGALQYLARKYGISPARVVGTGHSNGAMMIETLMCETNLFQKAVALAGSLMDEVDHCPSARGKEILAIHGTRDQNVPPEGGRGPRGVSNVSFRSETDSKAKFEKSGGKYAIIWVESDHSLEHLAAAFQKSEGLSLAEKEARFFGLSQERQ